MSFPNREIERGKRECVWLCCVSVGIKKTKRGNKIREMGKWGKRRKRRKIKEINMYMCLMTY